MSLRSLSASAVCALASILSTLSAQTVPCPITRTGSPCHVDLQLETHAAAPRLSLEAHVRSAAPGAFGVLLLGTRAVQLPLPLRGCPLRVDPSFLLPFATSSGGGASFRFSGPVDPQARVRLQAIVLEGSPAQPDFASSPASETTLVPSAQHTVLSLASYVDPERSGAFVHGPWVPIALGGSGRLGEFDVSLLVATTLKDLRGRRIYEWHTDDFTVPGTHSLTGRDLRVQNGVFEFTRLHVPSDVHVRILGTLPVAIHVAGRVHVEGALDASAPARNTLFHDERFGQVGGLGGPGGGRGGRGGSQPGLGQPVDGQDGEALRLPPGHPKGSAPGSGGHGSRAYPAGADPQKVVWAGPGITRICAAGGAGGSASAAGSKGQARKAGTPAVPYRPVDFGPDALPGTPLSLAPISTQVPSRVQFALGGAGGGGGGTHPFFATYPKVYWHAGAAGGGGGGVLQIASGAALDLAQNSELLVRGGDAADFGSKAVHPCPAAGGGGSGGSLLLQSLLPPLLAGMIDLAGGRGGCMGLLELIGAESLGGYGGPGYLRVEAPQRPDPKTWGPVLPAPTPDNAGTLLALDHAEQSLITSVWVRVTPSFARVDHRRYLLTGFANGMPLRYSNDPQLAAQAAVPGQWVVAHFQSALDAAGQPGASTRWAEGALSSLSSDPHSGPWLRWALRFDQSSGPLPADLRIDTIEIWATCN